MVQNINIKYKTGRSLWQTQRLSSFFSIFLSAICFYQHPSVFYQYPFFISNLFLAASIFFISFSVLLSICFSRLVFHLFFIYHV